MALADQGGALTRRRVLAGTGAVAGMALLNACGDSTAPSGSPSPSDAASSGPAATGGPTAGESPRTGAGPGPILASVSDVPVGSALSVEDPEGKPLIVAQPNAGDIVAFSAICTHRGCTVAPAESEIHCPCHGSIYDLTGKNIGGPAPAPLPPVQVTVTGGDVHLG